MSVQKDYQMVMAIVNTGFTDLVMIAAKGAGARGGTVMTAHGTGNKDIEKFFGVVVTPEKEIVMILVPTAIKDNVLLAINKEAGMDTKGQGIAFAMPVEDVVGIVTDQQIEAAKNGGEQEQRTQKERGRGIEFRKGCAVTFFKRPPTGQDRDREPFRRGFFSLRQKRTEQVWDLDPQALPLAF